MKFSFFVTLLTFASVGFWLGWRPSVQPEPGKVTTGSRVHASAGKSVIPQIPTQFPSLETVDECRDFIKSLETRFAGKHPLIRQAARDLALRRWLELDAESALAEAERNPGEPYREIGFGHDLFRVWLDLDVDSAVSSFSQASPSVRRTVHGSFFQHLAEKDGPRALALYEESKSRNEERYGGSLISLWTAWASVDPEAAQAAATKANSSEIQSIVSKALGKGEFENEFEITDPRERLRIAMDQFTKDPDAEKMVLSSVSKIATSDPEETLRVLKSLAQSTAKSSEYRDFKIRDIAREAFASLAAQDLATARARIEQDPVLAARGAMTGYFTYAFKQNSQEALSQCRTWMENPSLKDFVIEEALQSFKWSFGNGAQDLTEVMKAMPEMASKVDADVLSSWAKANPIGAADFLVEQSNSGRAIKNLQTKGVIAELSISQPGYTAAMLSKLADPKLQESTANTLVANWSIFDPVATEQWINSLPIGPLRDGAMKGLQRANAGK